MEDRSSLVLSLATDDVESEYTYRLTSPSSLLYWEGNLAVDESGKMTSPEMDITEGARFERGEYSLIVYSSGGTEISTSVIYSESDVSSYPFVQDGLLYSPEGSSGLFVTFSNGETAEVTSPYVLTGNEVSAYAEDAYFNRYRIVAKNTLLADGMKATESE